MGLAASQLGQLAEAAEDLGDRVGANEPGAANHLYAASGLLRELARERTRPGARRDGSVDPGPGDGGDTGPGASKNVADRPDGPDGRAP